MSFLILVGTENIRNDYILSQQEGGGMYFSFVTGIVTNGGHANFLALPIGHVN